VNIFYGQLFFFLTIKNRNFLMLKNNIKRIVIFRKFYGAYKSLLIMFSENLMFLGTVILFFLSYT